MGSDDKLARIETLVEEMHRELILGNGGPSIKQRVASLEESRTEGKTWIKAITFIFGLIWGGLELLFHLGGKK